MSRYFDDFVHDAIELTEDELFHYGVLGMKWGVRRYQPYSYTGGKGKEVGLAKKRSRLVRKSSRLSRKIARLDRKSRAKLFSSDEKRLKAADKARRLQVKKNKIQDKINKIDQKKLNEDLKNSLNKDGERFKEKSLPGYPDYSWYEKTVGKGDNAFRITVDKNNYNEKTAKLEKDVSANFFKYEKAIKKQMVDGIDDDWFDTFNTSKEKVLKELKKAHIDLIDDNTAVISYNSNELQHIVEAEMDWKKKKTYYTSLQG